MKNSVDLHVGSSIFIFNHCTGSLSIQSVKAHAAVYLEHICPYILSFQYTESDHVQTAIVGFSLCLLYIVEWKDVFPIILPYHNVFINYWLILAAFYRTLPTNNLKEREIPIYQYFTVDLCFPKILGVYRNLLFHWIFGLYFPFHILIIS